MPIPYFASPLGQPHKKSSSNFKFKRSRKRKRGSDSPVEPTDDGNDSLLNETIPDDDDLAETADKAVTTGLSPGIGLRQQHLDVLTSLLHRCILEKDYRRASRAWGMLLRMEVNGHPLDIRAQERWGIGAELLLHGGNDLRSHVAPEESETRELGERLQDQSADSFQSGLMKAKDYYERLILQYPFRKSAADSTSSLTFYPVMFGVWIHSIQLRYKLIMAKLLQNHNLGNDIDTENDTSSDIEYSYSRSTSRRIDGRIACHEIIIQDANKILQRLEELLISPPCSDHSGLWKIKGMLHLWITQLSDSATDFQNGPDVSADDDVPITSTGRSSYPLATLVEPQQLQRHPRNNQGHHRDVNLKAREAFLKVLALGDRLDARTRQEVGL